MDVSAYPEGDGLILVRPAGLTTPKRLEESARIGSAQLHDTRGGVSRQRSIPARRSLLRELHAHGNVHNRRPWPCMQVDRTVDIFDVKAALDRDTHWHLGLVLSFPRVRLDSPCVARCLCPV